MADDQTVAQRKIIYKNLVRKSTDFVIKLHFFLMYVDKVINSLKFGLILARSK